MKKCNEWKLGDTRFPDIWLQMGNIRYYVEVKAKQVTSEKTGELVDFKVSITGSRDISKIAHHLFVLIFYYPCDGVDYKFHTPRDWILCSMNQLQGKMVICDLIDKTEEIKENTGYGTFLSRIQPGYPQTKPPNLPRMGPKEARNFKESHPRFVEIFRNAMDIAFADAIRAASTDTAQKFGQQMEDWVREAFYGLGQDVLGHSQRITYTISGSKFYDKMGTEIISGPTNNADSIRNLINERNEELRAEEQGINNTTV